MKFPPPSPYESRLADLRQRLSAVPALQSLEPKTLHLVVAALALQTAGTGLDDAAVHGLGARRAGASWAEIEALGALVECVGGLASAGKSSAFLQAVQALDKQARIDGAVAAYG